VLGIGLPCRVPYHIDVVRAWRETRIGFGVGVAMRPMADVVVLPGVTGSVLRDSAGSDAWAPAPRALVTLGRSLADLELRDGDADEGVTAPMMIPDLLMLASGSRRAESATCPACCRPSSEVTSGC
jgi:hypothetical protein